jgi:adenylate kinase family enzyme
LNTTQFIFLLGPTNAGKGLLIKLFFRAITHLIKAFGLKVGLISFGNIIRDLRKNDPVFEREYGPLIDRGDLVPDNKAIEIFAASVEKLRREGGYDFVIVDGFCRSVPQIEYASSNGYLQKKDRVFMIEASAKTCLKRWTSRKTTSERSDDKEIETFYGRYHLHRDSAPQLRHMFKENEAPVIDLDAGHECEEGETDKEKLRRCKMNEKDHDGDKYIMEFVFPELLSHILPLIVEATARRPNRIFQESLHGG